MSRQTFTKVPLVIFAESFDCSTRFDSGGAEVIGFSALGPFGQRTDMPVPVVQMPLDAATLRAGAERDIV